MTALSTPLYLLYYYLLAHRVLAHRVASARKGVGTFHIVICTLTSKIRESMIAV